MKHYSLIVIFLTIALTTLTACQKNLAGRTQFMLVTESSAIEASKQAYVDTLSPLQQAGKVDNNPKMVQRVNRITDKLIQEAIKKRPETKDWAWSVKVIDEPNTVNAWCMAGGKMAIYTGLINKLNATDDEIAQVMGHEISHALLNHSAERMSLAMANNMALSLLQKSIDAGEQGMALANAAAQVALTLPNSRQGEKDADKVGIELAAKAGFDPNAAVTLWQKMAKNSGSGGFEFLSTHPSPENRQEKLKKMIPLMMPYYQAAKGQ
ncbi:M48 family metallopeptidase [Aliikangiella marina]|uniref:M48 family metallopeptidase n=1 Tax=Aliikangiella marina TaxID=1712262 RepID=A0A545TBZ3_9GAMM|nr:M48 family metallopeptidase [Aliikangiella marina]TQV74730.1 M48 family metallopeptidase [Aliikangiella marina]